MSEALVRATRPTGPGAEASDEEEAFVPRRQETLPGPALSPEEALKKWSVPKGFEAELVVSEPTLVNPVNMIRPRPHEFQVFAERTSNPWGDRVRPRGEPVHQRVRD